MKTYDETIAAVLAKGDAVLEQRRQKSVKIKQTSYAVSGICAAVIAGVGIWRMSEHGQLPDNRPSGVETVEETTNTSSSAAVTETTTDTTNRETTDKTTSSETNKTVNVSKSTTQTTKTESKTSAVNTITASTSVSAADNTTAVQTSKRTESAASQTGKATTTMTTVKTDTTTKTSITYDSPTESAGKQTTEKTTTSASEITTTKMDEVSINTTTDANSEITGQLPTIFNTIKLTETESLDSQNREQEFYYGYENINEENIGNMLKKVHLETQYNNNGEYIDMEKDVYLYEISGCSPDAMIAVKFEGSSEYNRYVDKSYLPQSFEELISDFKITAENIPDQIIYNSKKFENINNENLWEMLNEIASSADQTDHPKEKDDYLISDKLWFFIYKTNSTNMMGEMEIYPQGYLYVTITPINNLCFYIGEEKAKEIISYATG